MERPGGGEGFESVSDHDFVGWVCRHVGSVWVSNVVVSGFVGGRLGSLGLAGVAVFLILIASVSICRFDEVEFLRESVDTLFGAVGCWI